MSLNTDKLNTVDFTPTPRTDQVWNQGYDPDEYVAKTGMGLYNAIDADEAHF